MHGRTRFAVLGSALLITLTLAPAAASDASVLPGTARTPVADVLNEATAMTAPTQPCRRGGEECRRGWRDGYDAGMRYCDDEGPNVSSRGSGWYRHGYEHGWERATEDC